MSKNGEEADELPSQSMPNIVAAEPQELVQPHHHRHFSHTHLQIKRHTGKRHICKNRTFYTFSALKVVQLTSFLIEIM